MGLLQRLGVGQRWPQFGGKIDTSHIRALDIDVAPPQIYRSGGLFSDARQLSTHQMHRAYRSTVFFLANYRARNFSRHMLELAVERRAAQGEFEAVEEEHPWVQLLRRPNDYMPALEVWQWMYLNRDLTYGAHFVVEHERQGGVGLPTALHPVFDSYGRITPVLDGRGGITGWLFHRNDGREIPLRAEQVIRVAHESPFERGRACTLIEAAAYEIDEQLAASIYARDSATGQGRPEVLLEADEMIGAAEGNRISRVFAERYRAGSKSAGVPWTAGGLKAKEFQLTQKDMQFLEQRGFNKNQLYEIFEVQQSLFSDEAYATGRNAAFRHFAQNTVEPNLEIVVSQIEHAFERTFRADPAALRIAAPDPVPVDRKLQAFIDDTRLKNGTLTPNEVRRRDGEEEVEGGDEALVPATLTPLSAIGAGF